jgi:hypothetical protein
LVYLRARFYAPGMGRFLTKDTWSGDDQNPLTFNAWNYTSSNPINYLDPSGHCYGGSFWDLFKQPYFKSCPPNTSSNTVPVTLTPTMTSTLTPILTATPPFTPTISQQEIYQLYKFGALTPWEQTIGGQVSYNAHQLLAQADQFYFWGSASGEANSNPPLAGWNIQYPMPILTPGTQLPWGEISNIYDYTGGRTPFVCGDVPDWSYYMAGYNLQTLFPNVAKWYPNRWPRSSYGYLNMMYESNSVHVWNVKENPYAAPVVPEIGDPMVLQFDNSWDSIAGASHVVLVAEVYGNTADQIHIIEGNPDDGTIVKHTVQEMIRKLPDLKYLIFGHPNLP